MNLRKLYDAALANTTEESVMVQAIAALGPNVIANASPAWIISLIESKDLDITDDEKKFIVDTVERFRAFALANYNCEGPVSPRGVQ